MDGGSVKRASWIHKMGRKVKENPKGKDGDPLMERSGGLMGTAGGSRSQGGGAGVFGGW